MHPVLKLVAQRVALGFLLLFASSAMIFGLTEALPGDAAQAVLGQAAKFDVMASLPVPAFPGGPMARAPLLTLAMTWYAMRDRLGV